MTKKKQAEPNRGEAASKQILEHLGDLLKQARNRQGEHTLEEAATLLGFDKQGSAEGKTSNKANLHNIEKGNVALPWRRIVKFCDYAQLNSASVMVLLAAARSLREIESPSEQDRLEADIKAAFGIHPEENLTTLTRRLGLQPGVISARQSLRSRYPQSLWRSFLHLDRICPRLAAFPGPYFDINAEAAIFADSREVGRASVSSRKLLVVHGKTTSGGELVLLEYLRRLELAIPIDMNASDLEAGGSSDSIDLASILQRDLARLNLGVSPDTVLAAPGLVVVFRKLPRSIQALRRLHSAIRQFFETRQDARGFVLAEDHVPREWLTELSEKDAECFTLSPLREADGLKVLKDCCDIGSDRLTDWQLLALRHPLLLAAMVTMFEATKKLPDRWELIRAVAVGLVDGEFSFGSAQQGFTAATADLKFLAQRASDTLSDVRRGLEFGSKEGDERIPRLSQLVTLDEQGNPTSFAFASLHYYFAALHLFWSSQASQFSTLPRDVRNLVAELARKGDPAGAADLLEAVQSEVSCRSLVPQKVLREVLRLRVPRPRYANSEATRGAAVRKPVRWRESGSNKNLCILLEDQEPARALKRILNSPTISRPDDFKVRLFPADYDWIAGHIREILESPQSTQQLSFDIVACPHHSLAEALARANLCADLTAQTKTTLEQSIVARQYCRTDDRWYGVPFQFPTKFLCRRRPSPSVAPIPFGTWENFERFLLDSPHKLILQARAGHESLYYEWLAFSLAMGGGDLLWSRNAAGGTVILDSPQTVIATERFLRLIREGICHPESINTDWDNLIQLLLEDESAGLALPFSDTVTELSRGGSKFDFLPFGPFGDILPSPIVQTFGFELLPRHVLTAHVFVLLNHDPTIAERAAKFFTWFLNDRTQERFLEESLHSVWADRFITTARSGVIGADGLRTAAVAQQYGFFPPHEVCTGTTKGSSSDAVLSRGQRIVLGAISTLVEDKSTTARDVLREAATELRKTVF